MSDGSGNSFEARPKILNQKNDSNPPSLVRRWAEWVKGIVPRLFDSVKKVDYPITELNMQKDLDENTFNISPDLGLMIHRLEEDTPTSKRHLYYLGHLKTDILYPDQSNRYGRLTTSGSTTFTHVQEKGGLFVEICKDEKGKIKVFPILEDVPLGGQRHWKAVVEIPFQQDLGTGDVRMVADRLVPGVLVYEPGHFETPLIEKNEKGNWICYVNFQGCGSLARNFERIARIHGRAIKFSIVNIDNDK